MILSDIVELNPRLSITKGKLAPFIEMAALPTDDKYIPVIGERVVSGSGAKFQNGDTLFARITPCLENGKGGYVAGLPDGVVAQGSTEFIVFRAKDSGDEQFVYYISRHPEFRMFAEKGMEGTSGRQRVTWKTLSDYKIHPLQSTERRAIGEILASLDDKIELNRKMNETLEGMAREVFRDWFVDFGPTRRKMAGEVDPVKILGGAITAPTQAQKTAALFPDTLGENGLPEGWVRLPVGEISDIVGGGTPSTKNEGFWLDGQHQWATPRDLSKLSGIFIGDTERKLTDAGIAKVSSGLSSVGSVLMSSRAPIGYLAIARVPIAVNQGFIVMRPTKRFPTYFAKLWCEENMETIEANANGSTFQEISKKNFKPILVASPNEGVLNAFSEIVGALYKLIANSEAENQTLAEMRDLLLPKLMSGEIRLREGV